MSMKKSSFTSFTQTMDNSELKSSLNNCKPNKLYTSVIDLRMDCAYRVYKFDRLIDLYGVYTVVILEGLFGDDFYLTVPLARRFNTVLTDKIIQYYNMGLYGTLHMVRRSPPLGSLITPLEFV